MRTFKGLILLGLIGMGLMFGGCRYDPTGPTIRYESAPESSEVFEISGNSSHSEENNFDISGRRQRQ